MADALFFGQDHRQQTDLYRFFTQQITHSRALGVKARLACHPYYDISPDYDSAR